MILTADWHLVDTPSEAYRWRVFDELLAYSQKCKDKDICILGDLADKKDRHSSELVNPLCDEFKRLIDHGLTINVICGNHDMPLKGPPFWKFLDMIDDRLMFHTVPFVYKDVLLLPFSTNPNEEWEGVLDDPTDFNAIFMHQPVKGAITESGQVYDTDEQLIFPKGMPVWSGDIHTHQRIGQVRYVGAPHPIKFGDTYECRMIQLDKHYKLIDELHIHTIQKLVVDISSIDELASVKLRKGDQVKVRFSIHPDNIAVWPVEREYITAWAKQRAVILHSIEPTIMLGITKNGTAKDSTVAIDPLNTLNQYGKKEGLGEKILEVGQRLLKKAMTNESRNSSKN